MADLTRRALIAAAGLGAVGTVVSWPRLTGSDIPGRGSDALSIAILGTSQDAEARAGLVAAFQREHPEIEVRIQAIQGADWGDFFAKILTLVAAGTPPDLVVVATEGAQLFADQLAHPLDDYVQRDAAEMAEYFADVHPALVESFMYEGSLYQLPIDFNCANVFYNATSFENAGIGRPADDWTQEEFLDISRELKASATGTFLPYFWTNRLFGGVVPWLYVNDTSFLTETKAPGGEWLWSRFYADEPTAADRGGGFRWLEPNALDPRVEESFDFLAEMVREGLASSPAQGGGNELIARFAADRIGMTPAGTYWVTGLAEGGMADDEYDVAYFPRWRSQRHQFGAAGYAMMATSERKDEAWEWMKFCVSREGMEIQFAEPTTTPSRRSMVDADFFASAGPRHWEVFYGTLDRFSDTAPIPAPPQQAAVETALIKNVVNAVGGSTTAALATLQRDLEIALRRSA